MVNRANMKGEREKQAFLHWCMRPPNHGDPLARMLLLGFGCGLPYPLLGTTLSLWLSEKGVSLALIGVAAWFALPYSLKPLWAPCVDRTRPPILSSFFDQTRSWIVLSQLGVGLGLFSISRIDPSAHFGIFGLIALGTAFLAANQDMFVDGWRIRAFDPEHASPSLSCYQFGYRFGLLASGSLALVGARWHGWGYVYAACASLMLLPLLAAVGWAEVTWQSREESKYKSFNELIRTWPMSFIIGISLFRLPDLCAEPMKNPLLHGLGATSDRIGMLQGWVGLPSALLTIAISGTLLAGLSSAWAIVFASVVQLVQMALFAYLAYAGANGPLLSVVIGYDALASTLSGTVLVLVMSQRVAKQSAVVELAFLTGCYALLAKLLRGSSGLLIETIQKAEGDSAGFIFFFLSLSLISVFGGWALCRSCRVTGKPPRFIEPGAECR